MNCTAVSLPYCPVDNTIYGYYPNLGVNAFFIAFFVLCAFIQAFQGWRGKTYFYGYVMVLGCLGEVTGYLGRVIMHGNPYSDLGFKIQISCLIISPAFVAAGIYLSLKHLVLAFGQKRSKIQARYYTWIFILCDSTSLTLQGIGGGFAGGAGQNQHLRNIGTDLMMAGIIFQVVTLVAFGGLALDYAFRTWRAWGVVSADAKVLMRQKRFKGFLAGLSLAFVTVFTRCLYRIAEMADGWANPIMRDKAGFIALEGFMIVIAVLAMTIFHPWWCFPQLSKRYVKGEGVETLGGSDDSVEMNEERVGKTPVRTASRVS